MQSHTPKTYAPGIFDPIRQHFWRIAATSLLHGRWFRSAMPEPSKRKSCTGNILLEIVSHCWQYSNLLAYQLSSLVNYPPQKAVVTMTVFFSPEDNDTLALLNFFAQHNVKNVVWNWQPIERQALFRRGIGRNLASLASKADWIWFTDCDVIFHDHCIDELCEALQGRTDALVYPKQERITPMLADSDPMLRKGAAPQIVGIDSQEFSVHHVVKATGPLQIVHGDVARAVGYCAKIKFYQTRSKRWRKTYEDSTFRWLLGTNGEPLDIKGSCRIRHVHKGRDRKASFWSQVKVKIRRMQDY